MPHAHFIHHVPFEGPGHLRDWTDARRMDATTTWQHREDPLPGLDDLHLAVVTGGPMGILDKDDYPWLAKEIQWIRTALDQQVPLIGICLGAQLIAHAMGAGVASMGHKEIGWFPVHRAPEAESISWLPTLPDPMNVLHWHGDCFEIPAGAIRIWQSDRCDHQAFTAPGVLALQFHLEMGHSHLEQLATHAANELTPDTPGVQSATEMLANPIRFQTARANLFRLLDAWWASL